ncbi:hypothetical protein BC939DRAFT_447682 [Gamsiella multidivaricata]|uniref:uncharacterized protein n=1 Tax=Gamsiella multidivaricata TaxID=101098 RepID=UPI0022201A67|nr:uncharacterized protein BC939DRAFT_447682 [Gamsiella multidivaricata]KAI7826064.1 hypothetical protein BC939DRAFT_447682 [Gamsiella multidivaricata]
MDSYSTSSSGTRMAALRNLQPRAAAARDFNDSDEEETHQLSSDYKAQRKTEKDLIDFFKNGPPPPQPAPILPPIVVDDKKKRTLLQRLRARKTSFSVGRDSPNRSSELEPSLLGSTSSISTSSRGSEVATLPNGKKYIMIAVDYKDKDVGAVGGTVVTGSTALPGRPSTTASPPKRVSTNSMGGEGPGSNRGSILSNNPNIQVTTTIQDDGDIDDNSNNKSNRSSYGADKRRSIVIQAGGGEGSSFILDSTPFLLDNFALDTGFITPSTGVEPIQGRQPPNRQSASSVPRTTGSPKAMQGSENVPKRANKVTFNIGDQQQQHQQHQHQHQHQQQHQQQHHQQQQQQQSLIDEEAISLALSDRIANHKAHMAKGMLTDETAGVGAKDLYAQEKFKAPEVTLPKPISRKKVRHVQIQTQHCIMRPMYTQTEPRDLFGQDLKLKEFGTQTGFVDSATGTAEAGTSTETDSIAASSTITVGTSSLTRSEQEELAQLRQQNAALQARVASLERDLAAETRARTRTAVAMQDTRDKFEMLSAMAYKKLKEMIFQRHVLEMEVRELRGVQVEMKTEDGEMYNPQPSKQDYITVGLH